jgi:hypothetical protein
MQYALQATQHELRKYFFTIFYALPFHNRTQFRNVNALETFFEMHPNFVY